MAWRVNEVSAQLARASTTKECFVGFLLDRRYRSSRMAAGTRADSRKMGNDDNDTL